MRKPAQVPRKYERAPHFTTQIPRICIERLVRQLDSNLDNKVTAEDI